MYLLHNKIFNTTDYLTCVFGIREPVLVNWVGTTKSGGVVSTTHPSDVF